MEFYSSEIDKHVVLTELKMWKKKISLNNLKFKTAMDALLLCDKDLYPNINFLFKILCTLPVSTATPERTFSSLKRIKTYLRNSMSEVCNLVLIFYSCLIVCQFTIIKFFSFISGKT